MILYKNKNKNNKNSHPLEVNHDRQEDVDRRIVIVHIPDQPSRQHLEDVMEMIIEDPMVLMMGLHPVRDTRLDAHQLRLLAAVIRITMRDRWPKRYYKARRHWQRIKPPVFNCKDNYL